MENHITDMDRWSTRAQRKATRPKPHTVATEAMMSTARAWEMEADWLCFGFNTDDARVAVTWLAFHHYSMTLPELRDAFRAQVQHPDSLFRDQPLSQIGFKNERFGEGSFPKDVVRQGFMGGK